METRTIQMTAIMSQASQEEGATTSPLDVHTKPMGVEAHGTQTSDDIVWSVMKVTAAKAVRGLRPLMNTIRYAVFLCLVGLEIHIGSQRFLISPASEV